MKALGAAVKALTRELFARAWGAPERRFATAYGVSLALATVITGITMTTLAVIN